MAEIGNIQENFQEKWLLFWWALSIGLLALGIAWRQNLFKPFQTSLLPIIKGKDVLKGFGYFLFIELLLIPAIIGLSYPVLTGKDLSQAMHLNPLTRNWINLWIILGGFGAVLFAYFELTRVQRQQLWRQTATPWYIHVTIGIAAWFVSYPLVLAFSQGISLVVWHIFHHSFVEQVVVQNLRHTLANPFLFGLMALAVIFIVPLTEEFLFRGLLQTWLKHKFHNTSIAIVLSSFVFALFHYSNQHGVTNIELLSSLFLLSCMLGYIFERQRSLWAPVSLHSFFNFMSLLMLVHE